MLKVRTYYVRFSSITKGTTKNRKTRYVKTQRETKSKSQKSNPTTHKKARLYFGYVEPSHCPCASHASYVRFITCGHVSTLQVYFRKITLFFVFFSTSRRLFDKWNKKVGAISAKLYYYIKEGTRGG